MKFKSEEVKKSWQNSFTDPANHNDKRFVYLVVAVRNEMTRSNVIADRKKTGNYDPNQDINLREHPEKIDQIRYISASVVSQDRPYVFETHDACSGLIISCPVENILIASPTDLNTAISGRLPSLLKNLQPIQHTVQGLLRQRGNELNEILIAGSTDHGKVKSIGFFDKPNANSDFQSHATKMNFPLVRYPWRMGEPETLDIIFTKLRQSYDLPDSLFFEDDDLYTPGVPAFKPGLFSASQTKESPVKPKESPAKKPESQNNGSSSTLNI